MPEIRDLAGSYDAGPPPQVARRHVRLFRNGRNQAVRIPRDMELPGEEAVMYRDGDRLVIEPAPAPSLLALLASWEPLDEEFPEIEDAPPEPFEL
ncbi:MAG: AbrB/MazE/SpoVT family DNA-binding domain-containing protein [Dehalococcoidia bacterium]|nr:AbrB/MazE/SpoVT family DNA-binding domain-containing protein [Dehalococcoidia bacterium]MCA9857610.1 AbrB/MazE/SpoVT family DNA-binding domain-containing protein [Dehalococcoidia bacterium]